jgi:prepilin-type N-terminal cleavage/methylation domain-containing protein
MIEGCNKCSLFHRSKEMRNQKGFTLIELLVVVVFAIAGITMLTVIGFTVHALLTNNSENTISAGINGIAESRCINGYRFVIVSAGANTTTRQIMDEFGHGVRCEH